MSVFLAHLAVSTASSLLLPLTEDRRVLRRRFVHWWTALSLVRSHWPFLWPYPVKLRTSPAFI